MLSVIVSLLFGLMVDEPHTLRGDVLVQSNGPSSVVVYLDENHDGRVDRTWVISSKEKYEKPVSTLYRDAAVVVASRIVQIMPKCADDSGVTLALDEEKVEAHGAVFRGFGLAEYEGAGSFKNLPPLKVLSARGKRAYAAMDRRLGQMGSAGDQ